MREDHRLVAYGLGINDPKRIFGTTSNLLEEFGSSRVFDVPTSENMMTGLGVGLALGGVPSVVTHQRFDFFLLAMDQLVNSAAKWRFMFGGKNSVPITIRLIVGKGWGQGPTHSQSLHSWLTHIPGLKVVAPSNAADAKNLLYSSIKDPNPVIFIEHRWLHGTVAKVEEFAILEDLGKASIPIQGTNITVVSFSYFAAKVKSLNEILQKNGLFVDLVDLKTLSPIDWNSIYESVQKTGRLVVVDHASSTSSLAGEIIARVSENCFKYLKSAPHRIALPDIPEPTSFGLTKYFYISEEELINKLFDAAQLKIRPIEGLDKRNQPHDVPSLDFTGPF
jgi:pyruvate dehydrogenase E1 component beta subunit